MASRKQNQKEEEPVYVVDNTIAIPMPPIPAPNPAQARQQQDIDAAVRPASPVPNLANPDAAAAVGAEHEMDRSDSGYAYSASAGWPEHFRAVTAVDRSRQLPVEEPKDPNAKPHLLL